MNYVAMTQQNVYFSYGVILSKVIAVSFHKNVILEANEHMQPLSQICYFKQMLSNLFHKYVILTKC